MTHQALASLGYRMDVQKLQLALEGQQWAEADALLATVTAAEDAHPSLLYNHGKVMMELDRMAEAIDLLERAVQAQPSHASAWFELGRAALSLEQFDVAITGFEKALTLKPTDRDAARNLGRAAQRLGKYETAKTAWTVLQGDGEADLALYRIAAETRDPGAAARREDLLAHHPHRAAVLKTLVRVSKGAIPLNL